MIHCCSVAKSCLTLCNPMGCSTPGCTISRSLLKLKSIELVILSNHLILCCPLLLPSIFASIRVFSNEMALCIRWPKYCQQRDVSAFNTQSTFVIAFLPRSKSHLISWMQSPSTVILEPTDIKPVTVSIASPFVLICSVMADSLPPHGL